MPVRDFAKSLEVYWQAINALERAEIYKGTTFTVEPFLTGHGIYPFDLGAGEGTGKGGGIESKMRYDAYHHLMWNIDGNTDLLEIADRAKLDIALFDRPVQEYLKTGLMNRVGS